MASTCNIFISYRRLDSAIFSQWLASQLRAAYGQDCVFIDTENIRTAEAWAEQVEGSLRASSLVIVVIGKSWLSIADEAGRRRIDLPDDWVRREIETSLNTGKKIAPLLIDDAKLPAYEALPPSIGKLIEAQGRRMNVGAMAKEMADFVKQVGTLIGKTPISPEIAYPFPLSKIKALDEQNLQLLKTRLPTWQVVSRIGDKGEQIGLMRKFEFKSFRDAIHFMNTAARFIDQKKHHPEWTNIWRTLIVYLTTWDIGSKPSMDDVDVAVYLNGLYEDYTMRISQQDIDDILPADSAG